MISADMISTGPASRRIATATETADAQAVSRPPPRATVAECRETEFHRGWPAVLACFCVAVFAWGFGFYGQAVFLGELHRIHGWPVSTLGAATTAFYLSGAFLIPFVNQALNRAGPRVLLTGGVLLLGCGAAAFGNATEPWQLFASGLLMAVGWAATSGPAIATTLALWFDRRRGFAISLALNGASASGFTVAPLLVGMSHTIGLPMAVVEAVAVGWVILIPVILWGVRRQPSSVGFTSATPRPGLTPDRVSRSSTLRSWGFWSIALPFALAIAAQVGFIMHMVALLLPLLGSAGTGLAVTCSSLAAMLGRLALGTVIDRLPRRGTTAICFGSQACGLALVLAFPGSPAAVYTGIALFGLSVGNVITLPAVIVQAEFGAASFGLIIGLSGAISQFALAFGPGVFGMLHDLTGNYNAVLVVCVTLQVLASGLVLCRRRARSPGRARDDVVAPGQNS
jgi:MFS family permease